MEIIKTAIWSKARSTHLFAVLMLPRVAADANASQCRRLSAVPHDKLVLGKYRIDARGNFSSTCDIITVFVIIYLPLSLPVVILLNCFCCSGGSLGAISVFLLITWHLSRVGISAEIYEEICGTLKCFQRVLKRAPPDNRFLMV